MKSARLTRLLGISRTCLAAAGLFGLWLAVQPSTATGQITLSVGNATGPQGGTAAVTATLASGGQTVIGTDLIVAFDATVLSIDPSTCTLAPDLAAGNIYLLVAHFQPQSSNDHVLITVTENPLNPQPQPVPIRDGDLFTCTFAIAPTAPLGTTPLTVTLKNATCPNPTPPPQVIPCPNVTATDGSVTVEVAPTPTETPLPTATPTPTVSCTKSADCPPSQVCLNQVCSPASCTSSADCPPDATCTEGTCTALPTCTSDSDCPQGICIEGVCTRKSCTGDQDCPQPGRACVGGICVPAPTPTSTPVTPVTATPTNTVRPTATATNTVAPSATPTKTTPPATTTPTKTPPPVGPLITGEDSDSCNIAASPAASGSLLWLIVPVAGLLWKRRSRS